MPEPCFLALEIPFRGAPLAVRVEVSPGPLRRAHLQVVIEHLDVVAKNLDALDQEGYCLALPGELTAAEGEERSDA